MPEKAFPQTHAGMIDALEFIERAVVGCAEDLMDRAILVAGEVLANAVEHRGDDATLRVHVGVNRTEHQLVLTIREPVRSVAEESIGAATLPDDPLATSGRGLFLIRTLADEVQPTGDAGYRYLFRHRDVL